jgi:hypothetical protein
LKVENQGRSSDPTPTVRGSFTADDFAKVVAKIRYDLTATQAGLSELARMLASLTLPAEPAEFNERRWWTWVTNTAHVYTSASIADELEANGAPPAFVQDMLELADRIRAASGPASTLPT